MKKIFLISSCLLMSGFSLAQSSSFSKIKTVIQGEKPNLSLENKLIAVNYWKVSDNQARNCNKAFEQAYVTFYQAKLKGGSKGLVVICVNEVDPTEMAIITLSKDGVKESVSVGYSGLQLSGSAASKNVVYDAQGNEIFKDLPADQVFSSVQSLITR